ncbi:Kinetochore protein NDC80-like protein [Armadillidium nasatum]|uniref:Kinetochore protein NDC80 n=1 Tax=Armadillidium nasatum TaxID=96803 RepID=A0A5N5SPY2_9CRUS|nr:Kinetochore protein NDC80-like protein [Armadillidium nasatum]
MILHLRLHKLINLVEFLTNNNCPISLNRQMLRSPSRKDFGAIFHFIYQHINPKFTMSQRFEDEIPKILKALKVLKYPVQMPKSSFLNVGSPHTWPSVLAMLGWLIDLINLYEPFEECELFFAKDFEEGMDCNDINEIKTRSLVAFYREGGDDATPHVEIYKEFLGKEENISDEQIEKLNLLLEDIVRKYESMNSVKEQVKIAEKHFEELCNDREKILKFNEEMRTHLHAKDKERSHLAKILEDLQEERAQLIDQIKRLEEKKGIQSYSTAEMNMYKNFRNELAIQVSHLDMEKKTLNEQTWDVEVSIGKLRTKISELVIQYTTLCDKLQLPGCQISMSDLEANLPKWKEEILPVIHQELSREKQEAFDINNALMHVAQEKGKIEESVHTMECEKRKLECKIKRLQDESKHIREEKAEEEAILNTEVEALKDEISRMRMTTTPDIHELEKQFEEKTKELEKSKEKYDDLVKSRKMEMDKTMELIRSGFREREKMVTEFKSNLEAMAKHSLQNAKTILQAIDLDE